jgi:hypothetical protein
VLLWFVGAAAVSVWFVFRDPRFDLRVLALGALLPDLVDLPLGRVSPAHSLTVAVAVLVAVMLVTQGRRATRKRWLALPIGMLLHLVFDGVVGSTTVFWWPFAGVDLGDRAVPSVERGWWNLPLEALGAVAIAWLWRRGHVGDPDRRRHLVRTGQLVVDPRRPSGPPPTC